MGRRFRLRRRRPVHRPVVGKSIIRLVAHVIDAARRAQLVVPLRVGLDAGGEIDLDELADVDAGNALWKGAILSSAMAT